MIVWLCSQTASITSAQSVWEVTPYRIETWIATESDPRVPADWVRQLNDQVPALANAQIGAAWTVEAQPVPDSLRVDMMAEQLVSFERLERADSKVAKADKLIILLIGNEEDTYRVRVREFDLAARRWGPTLRRTVTDPRRLASIAVELICEAFSPLVRIESIEEDTAVASVRASALTRPADSPRRWRLPVAVEEGDVLQPIVRRADRSGNVGPKGVEVVPWTVLIAIKKQGDRFHCSWSSGFRQPFRTRRSWGVEQLAIRVRPVLETTTIKLVDRAAPEQPLVGYEVHAKSTGDDRPAELVGRSDWRGNVVVPRLIDQPVRILFVRSGQQLLGKLPIVPGLEAELIAPLKNDDIRLEAEGFLLGIQESLVDLVARREVLAARIRRNLADGKLDEADEQIKQLRRLDTREDFTRLVQRRKNALNSSDPSIQRKVDELFQQTQSLLSKYLDREQVDILARSLAEARTAGTGSGPDRSSTFDEDRTDDDPS